MKIVLCILVVLLLAIGYNSYRPTYSRQLGPHLLRPANLLQLYMSKADREKKKKKAADILKEKQKSTATSSLVSPSSTPWRVSSQSHVQVGGKFRRVPVRVQIQWAKAYKRLKQEVNTQSVTKRWKQVNVKNATIEEYTEIDYENTKPPAVFVDGYNIIGYLNSIDSRNIELGDARDCLISDLSVLQASTGWFIEVVFDAYDAVSGAQKTEISDGLIITYTSRSETADNHIERRFAALRSEGYTNMVVATDDVILRMIAGDQGAGFLSASLLVEEMRVAYNGWEQLQEELENEQNQRKHRLGDNLSDDIKAAIIKMKVEIASQPKKVVVKKMQQAPPTPTPTPTPQR